MTILPGSGVPGTAGEIRIRGASSLSGYKPVVFIDGVRFNIDDLGGFSATGGGTAGLAQSSQVTSAINNLNPNDIESIEIIKGPAAATLYGAEAANGVIQIITKKGQLHHLRCGQDRGADCVAGIQECHGGNHPPRHADQR